MVFIDISTTLSNSKIHFCDTIVFNTEPNVALLEQQYLSLNYEHIGNT